MLFGSLCSLSMGFTDVKSTVCLYLFKFRLPGINPEFVVECTLIGHPKMINVLEEIDRVNTLSCNEGSMRLRPEWPWRVRRARISVLMDQYNIEIVSCFLRPLLLYSSAFHQTNVEIAKNRSEDNFFNLQNSIAPSLQEAYHHDEEEYSIFLTVRKRQANIFLAQYQSKFFSPDRYSSCRWAGKSTPSWIGSQKQVHSFSTKNLDFHPRSFQLVVVVLLLVAQARDQFKHFMRNADPRVRIVFVHRILISTPNLPCR